MSQLLEFKSYKDREDGEYFSLSSPYAPIEDVIIGKNGLMIDFEEVNSKNLSREEKEKIKKYFLMWLFNLTEDQYNKQDEETKEALKYKFDIDLYKQIKEEEDAEEEKNEFFYKNELY